MPFEHPSKIAFRASSPFSTIRYFARLVQDENGYSALTSNRNSSRELHRQSLLIRTQELISGPGCPGWLLYFLFKPLDSKHFPVADVYALCHQCRSNQGKVWPFIYNPGSSGYKPVPDTTQIISVPSVLPCHTVIIRPA